MSAAPKIEPINSLFDKRLVNAFADRVMKTLKQIHRHRLFFRLAQTDVTPGKPYIEQAFTLKGDIAGMVGMAAHPLRGTLLISYKKRKHPRHP